jgi:putative tryptophan/tyrosine transport system substrate-binding protein
MHRREFLTLIGGVTVAWSDATLAQSPSKVFRVGLLSSAAMVSDASPFGAPFIRGLAQHGYVLGRNVEFERRAAEGHVDRLPRLLDELAASKVDVLITLGYPTALAAKQKNTSLTVNQKSTIPVVAFAAGDPVATGLVSSLAHPGGNITGISDVSAELTPKRMELLKQIAPALKRVAILWNAGDLGMTMRYRASETGAKALGILRSQSGSFSHGQGRAQRCRPQHVEIIVIPLTERARGGRALEDRPRHSSYVLTVRSSLES